MIITWLINHGQVTTLHPYILDYLLAGGVLVLAAHHDTSMRLYEDHRSCIPSLCLLPASPRSVGSEGPSHAVDVLNLEFQAHEVLESLDFIGAAPV